MRIFLSPSGSTRPSKRDVFPEASALSKVKSRRKNEEEKRGEPWAAATGAAQGVGILKSKGEGKEEGVESEIRLRSVLLTCSPPKKK